MQNKISVNNNNRKNEYNHFTVKGNIVYLAQGKYYEKITSRFWEM